MQPLLEPHGLVERLARLEGERNNQLRQFESNQSQQIELQQKLDLAKLVEEALEQLSGKLFEDLLHNLEKLLTQALQDVLEQPLRLITVADFKRGSLSIEFMIERDGEREHIMHGQGGSVANVLSVGLRMFALANRKDTHRQLLILDEPDCWLQPELVPRLVKIIKLAGEQLGIQVLLISHHQTDLFADAAERIHRLVPVAGSVKVETVR
jgi:ABC-type glutathione transport system ATPase component